jgi:hypothetical protein
MNTKIVSSNTCKNMQFCINKSLEYAENNDFSNAISSFISNVSKSECTECIGKTNFVILIGILNNHDNDIKKFHENLESFSICCKCLK